jgi:pimeloyl-[acyl-carrier protein] methyl ester esterase
VRLIVLPGLDGTGILSDPLCDQLARSFDVEAVRYPNDLATYEDALQWLLPRLPAGDYCVVAESFSGPLAVMLAKERPAGLKALILVASFARSPRPVPPFFAAILYLLPIRSVALIRLSRWLLVGKWGTRSFPEDFVTVLRPVPRRTLVRRLRDVLRVRVTGALQSVAVPRMLVAASADALVPARRTEDFRAAGWTVVTVDGPHFLNLTRPQEVANAIKAFLAAKQ